MTSTYQLDKEKESVLNTEKIEQARHSRQQKHVAHQAVVRIRSIVNIEKRKKHRIDSSMRSNWMIPSTVWLERAMVRVSLASLLRRYRSIRMNALVDAMKIIKKGTSREDNVKDLQEMIIEIAEAQRKSKEGLEE